MNPTVEIFSQGEELVTGQIADTNAAWLSQQLMAKGFTVTRHTVVGDKLEDLTALLREISERADCCICTGGLGPTVDDLTAEAVALAFACPLEFDPVAYQKMADYFSHRSRAMPESNRKQALLPKGSTRLDNDWGTAPGFALKSGRCHFAFVPGVPFEMKQLFKEKIVPLVLEKFTTQPCQLITIKTIGIGESDLQERLDKVVFPESVKLSFRTGKDENQTKLLFSEDFSELEMANFTQEVIKQIGDPVFAVERPGTKVLDITSVLAEKLQSQHQTLSILETLSQGLMAAKCLSMNSLYESWFARSIVQIETRLGIARQEDLLVMAREIAQAYRAKTATDYALVQLYDSKAADVTDNQQSVQLYNALASANDTVAQTSRVNGIIKRKQNQAALSGLDFFRRYLSASNTK